jgi:DNA-binding transcriptional ArsR family regulator
MKTAQAVKALAALAQDTRLAIYRLLVQAGEQGKAAGAIAERLGLPGATLSFHLKELANASLVDARQEGRFIFYTANYARMNTLLAYLTENCCQGDGCAPRACHPATKRSGEVVAMSAQGRPKRESAPKRVARKVDQ